MSIQFLSCTIDKVHNDYPSDNQFEKIMSLIDDLKENEFKPMIYKWVLQM